MIYRVFGFYDLGTLPQTRVEIATCFDRAAADALCAKWEELEIDEVPLIDRYGFPCRPADISWLADSHAEAAS